MEKLNDAKDLAKCFLYLELQETDIPFLVYHPFFESSTLCDKDGIFQAIEGDERYEKYKKDFYKNVVSKADSISSILNLIRKSYRLTFLKYLLSDKIITLKECGNLLAEHWSSIEIINHDVNVDKKQILKWISHADKNVLMDEDDLKVYNNLPETITVYRGCESKKDVKGISWTLDKNTADFFANRFNRNGNVYCGKIDKKYVVAYINNRDEKEVILDYDKVYDIEVLG